MSETVSRKRLLISFCGVLVMWSTYGVYLWWMLDRYASTPMMAVPIAIGGYLLMVGTRTIINVVPKLFGRNRVV